MEEGGKIGEKENKLELMRMDGNLGQPINASSFSA